MEVAPNVNIRTTAIIHLLYTPQYATMAKVEEILYQLTFVEVYLACSYPVGNVNN